MKRRTVSQAVVVCHSRGARVGAPGSGNRALLAGLALDHQVRNRRAAANLVKDLRAPIVPLAVARREAAESKRLARAVAAGRISLRDAIEQLRGAA